MQRLEDEDFRSVFVTRADSGIDPERDLRVAYSGAHDATALAVAGGRVDAGALNASVWDALAADGRVDPDELAVFFRTPGHHDYNWTAGPSVDAAAREAIADAFLALSADDPAEAELLALQRASGYVPTKAGNYADIEAAARAAGLID